MNADPQLWLGRLQKLHPNISNSKGRGNARFAPHKPLLLLCILDLADSSRLEDTNLGKSPELRLRFDSYWSLVQSRWGGRPGLDLPFHHLGSQGFWDPLGLDGKVSISADTTSTIRFNAGFRKCLQDASFRRNARYILIRCWFPELEQQGLLAAMGVGKAEAQKAAFTLQEESPEYQTKGRDARFRIVVVTQYRFSCALTGYGCHTSKGATLVEAAHVHAFSKSRNDNPENGLALTRDAHWMFDEGLWTVDEKQRVRVASAVFTEWGPEASWLKSRNGAKLHFLDGVVLRPSDEHLAWHRRNVFCG